MQIALPDPIDDEDAAFCQALRDAAAWYARQREQGALYGQITIRLRGREHIELDTLTTRRYTARSKQ